MTYAVIYTFQDLLIIMMIFYSLAKYNIPRLYMQLNHRVHHSECNFRRFKAGGTFMSGRHLLFFLSETR